MSPRSPWRQVELPGQGVFFLLWPLFARAPRHWFLENFLLSAPGVQSVFFLLRSVGRRDLSAGPEQQKKHHPGCFFFAAAPAKGKGRRSPVGSRHGARAKKKTPPRVFFFAAAPAKGKGRRSPVGSRHGARAKKKNTTQGFFFAPAPGKGRGRRSPVGRRHGARAKKKPRGRTLTHSLRAWVAMPPPRRGGVFFFFAAAPPGPGWCFFFAVAPPRRSLTHGGPGGVFFFLLQPRRVFLDNSKKCLGYYIGSKKTRRGHSFPCLSPGPEQKKKHPGWCFLFCSGPVPASNGASPSLAFRRGRSKKKHPGWCFFFCSGPVPASNGASPSLAFRRGRSKKKHPGWCFFFAAAPRGRSLTHCGPGWRCLPLAGAVFFFCCGPARTGVVFFFCCGPARTLTHSRWAGAISARPGWCFFFAAAPPGFFRE